MNKFRQRWFAAALVWLGLMVALGSARAAIFVVDSTGDAGANGPTNDGVCDSQPGAGVVCTLRAAIQEANGTAGADSIHFNIGGGGPQTISPGSVLPTITSVVTIDGTTQPGWVAAPIIEINGASSGGANGFTLSGAGSAGSTIKGLVIGQFSQGIRLLVGTSGNTIVGNYIGTDKAGTAPNANSVGVFIQDSPNNQVGGATAADRNVISANNPDGIQITGASATGNMIQGNYIGIDANGTTALGNAANGIAIFTSASNNTVGGTGAGAGNVISGNGNIGVGFGSAGTTGNLVQGNFIGTNAAGTAAVPNLFGVGLQTGPSGNTIGGAAAGAGNVISGNNNTGILIDGVSNNTFQRNLIGTDVSGNADLGNVQHGIHIINASNNNVIGGAGNGNVVSGNDIRGIDVGTGSSGNVFEDNIIGRNAANSASIPNTGGGIRIGSSNNTVGGAGAGVGNVIGGNGAYGVAITGTATGNAILQNSIFSNTGIGIDLGNDGVTGNDVGDGDAGSNNYQNYPVLSAAMTDGAGMATFAGSLNSAATTSYRIEFFANTAPDGTGFGEGERYLGFTNVMTDGSGNVTIGVTLAATLAAGEYVTATATDPSNNTSEFSAATFAVGFLLVTTTSLTTDGTTTSVANLIASPGADGQISLPEAITATNATGGSDTIGFGIPITDANHFYYRNDFIGSSLTNVPTTTLEDPQIGDFDPDYVGTPFSWFRIQPSAVLPVISDPLVIDAYTQPGAQANTVAAPATSDAILKIVIDGTLLAAGEDGLVVTSGASTIRGLVIHRVPDRAIELVTGGGNVVEGCYLGTDVTGTLDLGNTTGIYVRNGSSSNTIGGTTSGARNLLSGNQQDGVYMQGATTTNNVVQGNFIGTDVRGTAAIGNSDRGVQIENGASFNVIGGTSASARNIISGNGTDGVIVSDFSMSGTTGNSVQGNYVGTDVTGSLPLGNLAHGVHLDPVNNTLVGGAVAGAGNVIANNAWNGIHTSAITGTGNSFLRNSIYSNGLLGIDLNGDGVTANDVGDGDTGPNDLLNWPFIYQVSESGGTLTVDFSLDVPAGSYRVEFFKNPSGADGSGKGEGETFASSVNVTHTGSGYEAFSHSFAGAVGEVVTATATFCTDGATCAAFGSTSEFGNAFIEGVTAVELTSFTATGSDGAVDLFWQTGSELNNLGFHLYRASAEAGPYERITATPIPGLGSSPRGADYHFRDEGLTNGVTYYYQLEDVDTSGATELHGPVSATPQAQTENDPDPEESTIRFGDPAASSLKVITSSSDELVLELVTGGFYAEPQEDGSVRLSIPGFETLAEVGAPEIPVKRSWVDAVAGRQVQLVSVTVEAEETITGLVPSTAEAPEIIVGRDGTVRASRRRTSRGTARSEATRGRTRGVYPSESARLMSVGFQGDVKKALVELAPLRWDVTSNRLLLAHRLVVRLSFRGKGSSEETTDGQRGRRRRTARERTGSIVARLATKERGLYAVAFEKIFGKGRQRALSTAELRLSRHETAVAYHLEPQSDRFGPGSRLYFLSDGAAANPYGNEAVYELEVGKNGALIEEADVSPVGERVASYYWHTLRLEDNRYYQAALLDAPDIWLWETLLAPESKSFTFDIHDLASATRPPRLGIWLQGASDLAVSPDHHVRIYVNRVFVEETRWDGKRSQTFDVALPPGVAVEGENTLEIENVGDTGAAYSMVMLDRFQVVYPRLSDAPNGQLEGMWDASGVAGISGLGTNPLWLDTSESEPRWLVGAQTGADGISRARVTAGRSYLALSANNTMQPEVRKVSNAGLENERYQVDYLIIAPEAFLPAAAPLLELRKAQGLTVKGVSVEAIYSEFGYGEASPQAIKDFLSYAYHNWQKGPRYVVLLGDGTYDFKDYLGTGVRNQVPPWMLETSYLWTASDPAYAAVNGQDILPDLALGRLPAASIDEARTMVEKIVAYETGEHGLDGAPLVLVADDADRAGDFVADAEELASTTLAGRDVDKIYLSELGLGATREAVLQAFDQGAAVMSYIGHGGIHLWASENLLDISAVESLSYQSQQPILLTMNCLNGYFHFPYFNSLAEELLKAEGRGAVAAFSPSGLSLNAPAHRYHEALLRELLDGDHDRLGDAVMAAQEAYARSGAFSELLSIYHLLGDPALKLR